MPKSVTNNPADSQGHSVEDLLEQIAELQRMDEWKTANIYFLNQIIEDQGLELKKLQDERRRLASCKLNCADCGSILARW